MKGIRCKCGSLDVVKYIGPQFMEKVRKPTRTGDTYSVLDLYNCNKCKTTFTGDKYKVEIRMVD